MSLTTAVLCFEHSTSGGKEFSKQKFTIIDVGKWLITKKYDPVQTPLKSCHI